MNLTDLHAEFERQAQDAPDVAALAAEAERSFRQRDRRRRSISLLAAAAAVVVLVGGVALGVSHFRGGGSAPAGPPAVVSIPLVRLPADTQLLRHDLAPVHSPVSVIVPQGMNGTQWMDGGGRLSVGYYAAGWTAYSPADVTGAAMPNSAGYVITPQEADPITLDGLEVKGVRSAVTVGGHAATLVTAPAGAVDVFGMPAERRLAWPLADGRWIHVWADNSDGQQLLESFAGGVTERESTLIRTIGIGVTMPGLTDEWSVNTTMVDGTTQTSVYLCPPGVNLWAPQSASNSGSGSAPTAGSRTVTTSIAPQDQVSPISRCLGAVAAAMTTDQLTAQGGYTEMSVVGRTVLLDQPRSSAATDLGKGLLAVVGSPTDTRLSPDDLAAAVLSVRVSPTLVVLPGPQADPGVVVTESAAASVVGPKAASSASSVNAVETTGGTTG